MRTLIVVAHLDDETIGMGGSLLKMCKSNPLNIRILVLCKGRDEKNSSSRLQAFAKIQNELKCQIVVEDFYDMELDGVHLKEITKIIEGEMNDHSPDIVFTVSENDLHQDHQLVSKATKIACRPERSSVKELYEFEIPGCQPFNSTYYDTTVDITAVLFEKIRLCKLYDTEKLPKLGDFERFKTIFRRI
jgi:LmbE family N-acetylglucosaminyl deacetylase